MDTSPFLSQKIGHYSITAISDGRMKASLGLLSGIDLTEAGKIQEKSGVTAPDDIHIYCYLIRGQGRVILADSGMGGLNYAGGEFKKNLFSAGVNPDDIDTVLLTHGHPDHIGGLLNEHGQPAYRNAKLFLSRDEAAFWQDENKLKLMGERIQMTGSLVRRTLEAYGPVLRFTDEAEISEAIKAVSLPGHTPGHTGFLINSCDESLLIWGDIVHYPHIQSARPEVSISFDCDPAQAEKTRKTILEQAARQNLRVAGMHFGEPGFAYVSGSPERGYFLTSCSEQQNVVRGITV